MYHNKRIYVPIFVGLLTSSMVGLSAARSPDNQVIPSTLSLPASIEAGNGFTGTVVLNAQVETDTIVNLTADPCTAFTIPGTVTVTSGSSQVSFSGTAISPGAATITASVNGGSVSRSLTVTNDLD